MISERLASASTLPDITAEHIKSLIEKAISTNGQCYCALSGGSSPKAMLLQLAKKNVTWKNVTIIMVDERWTQKSDQQNQTMLTEFIDCIETDKPNLITLLHKEDYYSNLQHNNEAAAALPDHIDIVVLGMGLDGHTASLFPDSKEYDSAMKTHTRYVEVNPPEAPYPRISMSYQWLSQAHHLMLYIPGCEKLDTLHNILQNSAAISPIKSLAETPSVELTVFSSKDSPQ